MEDGPPGFPQGSTCPVVLGNQFQKAASLSPTGLSPSMVGLSRPFELDRWLVTFRGGGNRLQTGPATPLTATLAGLHGHGLGSSPFARRY